MAENQALLVIGMLIVVLLAAGLTYMITKDAAGPGTGGGNGTTGGDETPTIKVRGESTRTVGPDVLMIGISLETSGNDTLSSQSKNAFQTAMLKASLLAAGLDESQIGTSSYYTYPEYNGSCGGGCYYPYYGGAKDSMPAMPAASAASGGETGSERCMGPEGEAMTGPGGEILRCGTSAVSVETPVAYPADDSMMDIAPYPEPYPCGRDCTIIGYRTVHSIIIKANDTNSGGSYVESALNATENAKIDYIYFSISEATRLKVESELQAEAASAAKSKAEGIAKGLGGKLGKVVSVNPDWYYPYPAYAYDARSSAEGGIVPAMPTEIFPSDTTMYGSITVEYEIIQ